MQRAAESRAEHSLVVFVCHRLNLDADSEELELLFQTTGLKCDGSDFLEYGEISIVTYSS